MYAYTCTYVCVCGLLNFETQITFNLDWKAKHFFQLRFGLGKEIVPRSESPRRIGYHELQARLDRSATHPRDEAKDVVP